MDTIQTPNTDVNPPKSHYVDITKKTLDYLQTIVSEHDYKYWFSLLTDFRFYPHKDFVTIRLNRPSESNFFKDWIIRDFRSLIQQSLNDITERQVTFKLLNQKE